MRYILIRDGIVENIILWDGVTPYTPPDGCELRQSDTLQIGDAAD